MVGVVVAAARQFRFRVFPDTLGLTCDSGIRDPSCRRRIRYQSIRKLAQHDLGNERSTHSRDTSMIKGSIITATSQRWDLALGGVIPHIVQGGADSPGVGEQDLLHRLDGDSLDLARPRKRGTWARHGDVDV